MADDAQVEIIIKAVDEFSKEFDKLKDQLKKTSSEAEGIKEVGKNFEILGMKIPIAAAAIAAAATALYEFEKASYIAFSESELAAVGMKLALQDAGISSIDIFDRLTESLKQTTVYTDEELKSAVALAASFGFTSEQIQRLLPILTEMASKGTLITGQTMTLESALRALQMGADGSERALKQFGITLTDAQKEQLKTVEGGKRLSEIMDIIATKTKGANDALNATASGGMTNLSKAWNDFMTAFGGDLAPVFSAVGTGLTWLINELTWGMEKIQVGVRAMLAYVSNAVDTYFVSLRQGKIDWDYYNQGVASINKQIAATKTVTDESTLSNVDNTQSLDENTQSLITSTEGVMIATSKRIEQKTVVQQLTETLNQEKNKYAELWLKKEEGIALTDMEIKWMDGLGKAIASDTSLINSLNTAMDTLIRNKQSLSTMGGYGSYGGGNTGAGWYNGTHVQSYVVDVGNPGGGSWQATSRGTSSYKGTMKVNDFMIAPGGEVLNIHPNDTIVGFKGDSPLGGGGVNIKIDNIYGLDANSVADALQNMLQTKISI